ncbi:hypothetical protein FQA47_010428 [Oryzias melastigma]|uniref:Uncharacterized protein n=1 Tax=Oryzias melastigma TaxID=30732 RepID=A0A834BWN6_ORYME|nr:hypothetical protein FQA47_010428 [Oryzias melastigma]
MSVSVQAGLVAPSLEGFSAEVCSVAPRSGESDEVFLKAVLCIRHRFTYTLDSDSSPSSLCFLRKTTAPPPQPEQRRPDEVGVPLRQPAPTLAAGRTKPTKKEEKKVLEMGA